MAQSDSAVPFSIIDGAAVLSDGAAASLTLAVVQGEVSWTNEMSAFVEARSRNKHLATPTVRKTGHGNVVGTISLLISSFYGSSAVTPYEAFTQTAGASAWTTRGAGDKILLKLALTATGAGGAPTQTIAFNYCAFSNIKIDPSGGDGLYLLTAEFVDHEEAPTVT